MNLPIKRITIALGLASLIAIMAWSSLVWWSKNSTGRKSDNAYLRTQIVSVSPEVTGYVSRLLVDDHQSVEAGDILLEIDPKDFLARRDQARAAHDATLSALRTLEAERLLQLSLIEQAEAGLRAARAEALRAGQDRNRVENLLAEGWTTKQRQETVVAIEAKADAAVAQAEAALASNRQKLGVLDAKREQLSANSDQAKAALELAGNALEKTVIKAPVSGRIGNRKVEPGQFVRPGVPLLSVVSNETPWIIANFKETQLVGVAPGQKVSVHIDAIPNQTFDAHVDSLAPASGAEFSLLPPDNATGNFIRVVQRIPVKIRFAEDQAGLGELRAGMSAKVAIHERPTTGTALTASVTRP